MKHNFFLSNALERFFSCEREAMTDRDTKMPIVGRCNVSNPSRRVVYYQLRTLPGADLALRRRGLRGAAPGTAGEPSCSSSLSAYGILSNQPGPPLS